MRTPAHSSTSTTQSVGDDITLYIKVEHGRIADVKFDGNGCAISIASASLLTDEVKSKKLSDVEAIDFARLKEIIGIDPGPVRLKCATLSLKALKKAAFLYEHKKADAETERL